MSQALEESFDKIDHTSASAPASLGQFKNNVVDDQDVIVNPPSGFKDVSLVHNLEEEEEDSLKDSGADLTSPKAEEDEEYEQGGRAIKVYEKV